MGQYFKAVTEMYAYDNAYLKHSNENAEKRLDLRRSELQRLKEDLELVSRGNAIVTSESQAGSLERENEIDRINGRTHGKVMLVSSLAQFDSFLNNVTKLVLCVNPQEALKNYNVPVSVLLTKSRSETINYYISKRAAELSRKKLSDRLDFVRTITKQRLSISEFERVTLGRLFDQRNAIIHEQQHALFTLNEDLAIDASFDDTEAEDSTNDDKFDVPESIAARIFIDVMQYILGRKMDDADKAIVAAIQKALQNKVTIGETENTFVDVPSNSD